MDETILVELSGGGPCCGEVHLVSSDIEELHLGDGAGQCAVYTWANRTNKASGLWIMLLTGWVPEPRNAVEIYAGAPRALNREESA